MTKQEEKQLIESDKNGKGWFNSYQDVDAFLFSELDKLDLEFTILKDNDKPHLNTIEAIKRLIEFNNL